MEVKVVFPIRVISRQPHLFAFSIFIVFMDKGTQVVFFFSLKIQVKMSEL